MAFQLMFISITLSFSFFICSYYLIRLQGVPAFNHLVVGML